ncbi:pyridoxamine 5'-phosphate oxidase family protein [Desulfoluna spongiiphila]|uniref:Pyridoxamine 5'-phosphate oxidase n=1 Tax=Desulfoluna spongiiphila TaxID=419481 RepID=A0A1G5HYT5_9BACT|nr:pyridoxamine 5'-phosphate oxidase family protein [Desulfoluna spongiiphila]SCY68966.1 Pyridoxamine 5'-phosphate oxidase [Desulfoluna spongiiphila]
MTHDTAVVHTIRTLLEAQRLGVLSTHCQGHPYASLVAFGFTEDLSHLFFATPRSTRKYGNMAVDDRVAMLIDSRSNGETDFHEARAVTVTGRVSESSGPDAAPFKKLYLARHPYLNDFLAAPTCAFMVVTVRRCVLVERFQNVTDYEVTS